MILAVYLMLLGLSISLIIIGAYTQDDAYQLVGFLFLFLLGTYLLGGFDTGLDLPTGENTTINFTYSPDNSTILSADEVTVKNYESYENKTFGFFLAVGSALALIITLFRLGREKRRDEE